MTEAVVFVLSRHLLPHAAICYQYCLSLGYHAIGIVRDDWDDAWDYIRDGTADVIVVADETDLEPDRSPRIEIVAHTLQGAGPAVTRPGTAERTRLIRRRTSEE
jgi:hypothetical protein